MASSMRTPRTQEARRTYAPLRGPHLRITRESKPGAISFDGRINSNPLAWLCVQFYQDWNARPDGEIVQLFESYNPNVRNNAGGWGAYCETVDIRDVAIAIGRLRARLGPLPVESRTRLVPAAAHLTN
jgi:hypothetical protein